MPALPLISGSEAKKAFERLGWQFVRLHETHMILVKHENPASLSVPDHREVARGTLRSLIRSAGLTVEEFISEL